MISSMVLLYFSTDYINLKQEIVTAAGEEAKNHEDRGLTMNLRLTALLAPTRIADSKSPFFLNSEDELYRNVKTAFHPLLGINTQ